jgi:hypothetical protein
VSEELDKLERDVEREMQWLGELPAIVPRPACLEGVKAAVCAEAQRVAHRQRLLRWTGTGLGAAAAVVFVVVGITLWTHGRPSRAADPEAALTEWAAALDESNARLASVLSVTGDTSEDDNAELDELLRGLDESLWHFENLESGQQV